RVQRVEAVRHPEADLLGVVAVAGRAVELRELLGIELLEHRAKARDDDVRHVLAALLLAHVRPGELRLFGAARRSGYLGLVARGLGLGRGRAAAGRQERTDRKQEMSTHR